MAKFDLANLKIEAPKEEVETTEVSTPETGNINITETLSKTGADLEKQVGDFGDVEENIPTSFKIQPKNNRNLDKSKISRFIEHSKGLGKTREETEQAYIKGLNQGMFNLQEIESLSEKEDGGFFNKLAGNLFEVGQDIVGGIKKTGSDIRKIQEGQFKREITGQEPINPSKKGLLGKVISAGIQRERNFSSRKQEQGETGATGIEKGGDVVGQGAGLVSDIFGETFMAVLKTTASEEQEALVKETIVDGLNSDIGKEGITIFKDQKEGFDEFEKQNPRIGSLIRNAGNFGVLIADVVGFGAGKATIKTIGSEMDNMTKVIIDTAKSGKEIVEKGVDIGLKKGGKIIEAGKEKLVDFLGKTAEGKKLKKEIETIKNMGTKKADKTFRNKQAESLIAETNSMLPLDKEKFKQIAGKDYQSWLNERGLRGTGEENIDKLATKFIKERNAIDSALEQIPGRHNPKSLAPIMDEILEFAVATDNIGNVKFIQGVKKGIEATGGASAKDIRKIKQIYEKENKFSYMKDTDSVKTNRATNRDNALREDLITIANDFGLDLRDVSKELQQTVAVMNGIGKKLGRQTDGNVFDISDRILLPTGFVEPSILLGIGAKNILTSAGLKSAASKILGNAEVKIPTLKEPRLKQKIKEFVQLQKDLKKSTKKEAKLKELERIQQEIKEMIDPNSQLKLPPASGIDFRTSIGPGKGSIKLPEDVSKTRPKQPGTSKDDFNE